MVPMSGVGGVGKAKKEASKRGLCVSHGSQEWGKGLGRPKTKNEKGVGYFMVHKRVGRAWEGSK